MVKAPNGSDMGFRFNDEAMAYHWIHQNGAVNFEYMITPVYRVEAKEEVSNPDPYAGVPDEVETAMKIVREYHPSVCAVAFFPEQRWIYFAADGSSPVFKADELVLTSVLEQAMDAAYNRWKLPHVFELEPMGFAIVDEGTPAGDIAFRVDARTLGEEDGLILVKLA